jgi:hydroxyacylglutathione hydrolase
MQPQELLKRMKSRQPPTVLDVRSGVEFRNGHIPGAIHSPALKILVRMARIPSDKNAELVLTCEHGPRARLARGLLGFLGYRNVVLLEGHMSAWRQAGRPMQK